MTGRHRIGDEPLDLCLVSQAFHPAYAGPAIRFKRYAPGFRKRGVEMRVFAADRSGNVLDATGSVDARSPSSPEWVDGIRVDRVRVDPRLGKTRAAWRFESALFHYCATGSPPGVVQLLSLRDTTSPHWIRRLRGLGSPVIYTHTMMRDPNVGPLKNRIWLRPFRQVDCTVVSTSAMLDSLLDAGFRGVARVIPNGVDTDRFRPAGSAEKRDVLRRRLGLPVEAELVTFVGGYLIRRKGVDLLADAWGAIAAKRPSAHLLLVGPTFNALRPAREQTAFLDRVGHSLQRSGAVDRVITTGAVDNVEEYLRASDVFVFPSRREGMPNVVLEAYATAVPSVLCPFVGMSREFGQPGVQYLSARHDAMDISRAVLDLLGDPSLRARVGGAARDWILGGLEMRASLDAYCDLYREFSAAAIGRGKP